MKKSENDWKRTTILLTVDQCRKLDKIGKKNGINRSATIRMLVQKYLEEKK